MKKVIAILLSILILTLPLVSCAQNEGDGATTNSQTDNPGSSDVSAETPEQSAALDELMEIYSKIEPLEEETTIRYIGSIGLQLSAPLWMAEATGALKDAGITLEFTPATAGPLSIEALTAGEIDLVGTGIGGIAVAAIQGTGLMLSYINNESAGQKFYVKGDSPLASAEFNEETGFYGTAEDWKGKEVYMPAGTTLQYLMGYSLEKIGLTLQDIKPVYMEANSINSAMYAGKGEAWGIWNFMCYAAAIEENNFVPVIEGNKVGIDLMTAYVTNESVWQDAQKRAAIEKILEYHFATVEWMTASEENMAAVAQIMYEWVKSEGGSTTYDEMYQYLLDTDFISYEENRQLWTEEVTDSYGTMCKALNRLQGIMDFYIEQGNYTEDDRAVMIENQKDIFIMDGLDSIPQ